MLIKILIDRKNSLDWELEEKLLKLCNGFEVDNSDLILWAMEDIENITSILDKANVSYKTFQVEQKK